MELKSKNCIPCEGGVSALNGYEVDTYMKLINTDWTCYKNKKIGRKFYFVNFIHTMKFVNKVAEIAEKEGHHPDLHIHYGECIIELWTHAIGGLSENDFILAAKIDEIKSVNV